MSPLFDNKIVLDESVAKLAMEKLYRQYTERKGVFSRLSRSDAPQTVNRPSAIKIGSRQHAQWLFFATMTDRRDQSARVYQGHNRLWHNHPELYHQPIPPLLQADVELEKKLERAKISLAIGSARNWFHCSQTLFARFEGDPVNVLRIGSIDQILASNINLLGFGPKLLSLLAIFYQEIGLIALPEDAFPVDVHGQRFALSTGILACQQPIRSELIERKLRYLYAKICREQGWSVVEMSHAIWFLGNQLCTNCPKDSVAENYCPVYKNCGGAVKSRGYFTRGIWNQEDRYPKSGQRKFGVGGCSPLFQNSGPSTKS